MHHAVPHCQLIMQTQWINVGKSPVHISHARTELPIACFIYTTVASLMTVKVLLVTLRTTIYQCSVVAIIVLNTPAELHIKWFQMFRDCAATFISGCTYIVLTRGWSPATVVPVNHRTHLPIELHYALKKIDAIAYMPKS